MGKFVLDSNEGLGGNWGSKMYVSNGGQQNNTEHVTHKTNPRAKAPEVCEKTFSTYFVPQPVENKTVHFILFLLGKKRPVVSIVTLRLLCK